MHEQEPAFDTFMDNIESSLQVIKETEELLESMRDTKARAIGSSPRGELRANAA